VNDLPVLETVGGHSGWRVAAHQLSAFRSCAKQIGLPIEVVLRAAQTGQLGRLIETRRSRSSKISPGRPNWGTRDPEKLLDVLKFKRHPPF
jgi:hypothetical protein